ncbi:MAG: glycogen debranching protein GlgX [Actinomycetota bacterium]|nr:glycogen debranching protein GlgX [Actinomycetota bacterium]
MSATKLETLPGRTQPLGATPDSEGVNFSLYAEHATGVELLLFPAYDAAAPEHVIVLDPAVNRDFYFWHVYVKGIQPGQVYAYRVDGPFDPSAGYRFNRNKVLIDPYACGNVDIVWNRANAVGLADNVATSMRSVVIDCGCYDWEGDRPLNTPLDQTIVYEMHVRGFTCSPTSGCEQPGKFSAVIEKIPYLKELGITAVELLPIFDFDETEVLRHGPGGEELYSFWGYDPYSFFAPQQWYCVNPDIGKHVDEFRNLVKALHKAGIEVILDVVYNHTSEGNHEGPTINFRGVANKSYYHLSPQNQQYYMNYSGAGNAVNANHPLVTKLISESLEYWVTECHVDGFRFDLSSVLSRGPDGAVLPMPPVVWTIELAEALADTKVIAEAWDAGGLYQVGGFPGERWSEWNGRYRDDIRRFVKGDPGLIGAMATRIAGSADLYQAGGRRPTNSVNFVTCHDGFTLNDLVTYNWKHNEANGEGNRDGANDNNSWNCGVEGETDNPEVERLRQRQIKNFAAILLLSQGVPMILGGDECRRTQLGNNNAYCQDNHIGWFDWSLIDKNADMLRFFKHMIAFRKRHAVFRRRDFFTGAVNDRGLADIAWHGCRLNAPGWEDPDGRALAFTLGASGENPDIHVLLNMFYLGLDFELPQVEGRQWWKAIDTAQPSPTDIPEPGSETLVDGDSCHAQGHSVVVLLSKPSARSPGD